MSEAEWHLCNNPNNYNLCLSYVVWHHQATPSLAFCIQISWHLFMLLSFHKTVVLNLQFSYSFQQWTKNCCSDLRIRLSLYQTWHLSVWISTACKNSSWLKQNGYNLLGRCKQSASIHTVLWHQLYSINSLLFQWAAYESGLWVSCPAWIYPSYWYPSMKTHKRIVFRLGGVIYY